MPKQSDDLTREGDKKQKTKQGLEIPTPKRKDFIDNLRKVSKEKPSK